MEQEDVRRYLSIPKHFQPFNRRIVEKSLGEIPELKFRKIARSVLRFYGSTVPDGTPLIGHEKGEGLTGRGYLAKYRLWFSMNRTPLRYKERNDNNDRNYKSIL